MSPHHHNTVQNPPNSTFSTNAYYIYTRFMAQHFLLVLKRRKSIPYHIFQISQMYKSVLKGFLLKINAKPCYDCVQQCCLCIDASIGLCRHELSRQCGFFCSPEIFFVSIHSMFVCWFVVILLLLATRCRRRPLLTPELCILCLDNDFVSIVFCRVGRSTRFYYSFKLCIFTEQTERIPEP